MRRTIRAVALGQEPGDLSGLEDPAALANYACECRGYIDEMRSKLFPA